MQESCGDVAPCRYLLGSVAAVMQQLDHRALCEIESFTGHGMHGDPFQQGAGAQHKVRRVRSIPRKLRCTEGQDWPLWP
jgi:hypothetical protein